MHLVVGEPIVNVTHVQLENSKQIEVSGDQKYSIGKLYTDENSPNLLGLDNKKLGVQPQK